MTPRTMTLASIEQLARALSEAAIGLLEPHNGTYYVRVHPSLVSSPERREAFLVYCEAHGVELFDEGDVPREAILNG